MVHVAYMCSICNMCVYNKYSIYKSYTNSAYIQLNTTLVSSQNGYYWGQRLFLGWSLNDLKELTSEILTSNLLFSDIMWGLQFVASLIEEILLRLYFIVLHDKNKCKGCILILTYILLIWIAICNLYGIRDVRLVNVERVSFIISFTS